MYATIHRFWQAPDDESTEWVATLTSSLYGGSSPAGLCVLRRLDGTGGAAVALWTTEQEAAAVAGRRAECEHWLGAHVYRVSDVHDGVAAGQEARFAEVTWFDGADAEQAEARERAGRERIWPAVRDVDGVVGVYVLRSGNDSVVIGLSTSVETPEAVRRAIFGTRLLPWENPDHLTGPSGVEADRVLFAQLPSAVRS